MEQINTITEILKFGKDDCVSLPITYTIEDRDVERVWNKKPYIDRYRVVKLHENTFENYLDLSLPQDPFKLYSKVNSLRLTPETKKVTSSMISEVRKSMEHFMYYTFKSLESEILDCAKNKMPFVINIGEVDKGHLSLGITKKWKSEEFITHTSYGQSGFFLPTRYCIANEFEHLEQRKYDTKHNATYGTLLSPYVPTNCTLQNAAGMGLGYQFLKMETEARVKLLGNQYKLPGDAFTRHLSLQDLTGELLAIVLRMNFLAALMIRFGAEMLHRLKGERRVVLKLVTNDGILHNYHITTNQPTLRKDEQWDNFKAFYCSNQWGWNVGKIGHLGIIRPVLEELKEIYNTPSE